MLRIFSSVCTLILCITIMFITVLSVSGAAPEVSASSAVSMLFETGEVLYEKNGDTVRSMASTTKIMTALLGIKYGKPDKMVKITAEMLAEGTSSGLCTGDKITLYNLLYAMMLQSGNDAANAVAFAVSGSMEKFASLMNNEAKRIGMKNTHFVTPSGLDADEHFTTAYDMALLTKEALSLPAFKEICSEQKRTLSLVNSDRKIYAVNHNRLLSTLDGTVGVKTGFTKKSGRCLVSAVERNGVTVINVTLNAPNDWEDHKKMTEYAFSVLKKADTPPPVLAAVHVVSSSVSEVDVHLAKAPLVYEKESGTIQYRINMRSFEYAPVNVDDTVGSLSVYRNGIFVENIPIIADEQADIVKNKSMGLTDLLKRLIFP